jgi:N-acetylglucosamine-6-sulfatase
VIKSKQPQAQILLMGIFPTGQKFHAGREKQAAINKIISQYADGKTIHFFDLWDKFLEPDGTISKEMMGDYLHLEPKAYDIWAEGIKGKLNELLGEAKGP